ncbi:hypothetical protein AAE478_008083 [Parahypoxylon ruwenzoriense]
MALQNQEELEQKAKQEPFPPTFKPSYLDPISIFCESTTLLYILAQGTFFCFTKLVKLHLKTGITLFGIWTRLAALISIAIFLVLFRACKYIAERWLRTFAVLQSRWALSGKDRLGMVAPVPQHPLHRSGLAMLPDNDLEGSSELSLQYLDPKDEEW